MGLFFIQMAPLDDMEVTHERDFSSEMKQNHRSTRVTIQHIRPVRDFKPELCLSEIKAGCQSCRSIKGVYVTSLPLIYNLRESIDIPSTWDSPLTDEKLQASVRFWKNSGYWYCLEMEPGGSETTAEGFEEGVRNVSLYSEDSGWRIHGLTNYL